MILNAYFAKFVLYNLQHTIKLLQSCKIDQIDSIRWGRASNLQLLDTRAQSGGGLFTPRHFFTSYRPQPYPKPYPKPWLSRGSNLSQHKRAWDEMMKGELSGSRIVTSIDEIKFKSINQVCTLDHALHKWVIAMRAYSAYMHAMHICNLMHIMQCI